MSRMTTVTDIINSKFYNDIFNKVTSFVSKCPDRFEEISSKVPTPDEIELFDFTIKFLSILKNDAFLTAHIVLEAELQISETMKHGDIESDAVQQWIQIDGQIVLDEIGIHLDLKGVDLYNTKAKGNLSEYLVPIIAKNKMDAVATIFLEKYCPQALTTPMALPVDTIVEKMGLQHREACITKTGTVFGQIFFKDADIECYDEDHFRYYPQHMEKGTILIDPKVFFMRTLGSVKNTIIHECVHWEFHRNFFLLQQLQNDSVNSMRCSVEEECDSEESRGPYGWMEWQANALAPRILMPAATTKRKTEELLKKYHHNGFVQATEIFEKIITDLADFFQVSKLAAKIRLVDLGYDEALGVLNYREGEYLPNYAFKKNSLKSNQTYVIALKDIFPEYVFNPAFRKIIDSGQFVYVNGVYCINAPKYVEFGDYGEIHLTEYALNHMDECCLVFSVNRIPNNHYNSDYYKKCILCRGIVEGITDETHYSDCEANQDILKKAEAIKEKAQELSRMMNELPRNYPDALVWLMKQKNITVEQLAEKAMVDSKTISRMRTKADYKPTLETVVAICIALQLDSDVSFELLKMAGRHLDCCSSERDCMLRCLLKQGCSSVQECNEILSSEKLPPLKSN